MGRGAGCNGWEWKRKIEDKEEATDSSFLKRENSREWRQFGYLAAGLFQVGCRSMFIHVKGWVVRGSGWLKDSGGGRGCNKRNGYSRAARMPSPRDDRRSVFTQQRVASYNRENAHPFRPPPPLVAASRPIVPQPRVYSFRCPATPLFSLCLPFYFDLPMHGKKLAGLVNIPVGRGAE